MNAAEELARFVATALLMTSGSWPSILLCCESFKSTVKPVRSSASLSYRSLGNAGFSHVSDSLPRCFVPCWELPKTARYAALSISSWADGGSCHTHA